MKDKYHLLYHRCTRQSVYVINATGNRRHVVDHIKRGNYRLANGEVYVVDALTHDLETGEEMLICIPQQGQYVGQHLTCRLNAFELMLERQQ